MPPDEPLCSRAMRASSGSSSPVTSGPPQCERSREWMVVVSPERRPGRRGAEVPALWSQLVSGNSALSSRILRLVLSLGGTGRPGVCVAVVTWSASRRPGCQISLLLFEPTRPPAPHAAPSKRRRRILLGLRTLNCDSRSEEAPRGWQPPPSRPHPHMFVIAAEAAHEKRTKTAVPSCHGSVCP